MSKDSFGQLSRYGIPVGELANRIGITGANLSAFGQITTYIVKWIADLSIMKYVFEFVFGIPIAAYCFSAVWGNKTKAHTGSITKESMANILARAHRLPLVAFYLPLALFILIYLGILECPITVRERCHTVANSVNFIFGFRDG